ncbi:alpha/beta hydrolase [Nocardioides marmotae]|uniref:Alpha/beta hydrolase fold domain-containing protein n=1 Tax=Nocardioides marmotae TaxID=2663857 RepID=A0A6I3JD87_9ACTN|nr:alpha/beta hydrolase [Nocardioides marmotae]MCR6032396.1 alpha/beta hydrolase fold domain-containing protein [Gordonia jinghuaiqii]MBC9733771.1 alpha/beta hydrolase [Nocardioides marmotae]MTB84874.1 alpha/beta hydrolase fold domain-containing protein [Nocardioides marmotae]MTB96045.1 alpha/beta hydrolase fold domain-containing protein [Nocardioides marmotae]QKE02633.1 alpha/beta hydrolase [Nocardioides marmotae]
MAIDPQIDGLLQLMAGSGHPPMWQQSPEDARRGFRVLTVDLRDPAFVPEVAAVEDVTVPGAAGPLAARIYRPSAGSAGSAPLPTVAFFHGGGFVIGDLDTHDLTCRTIATLCEAVVVSVDYRLAPEHPFPAAPDDALAAAHWVADSLADLGGSDRMGVAGDSAGGNLSAVVAQAFRDEGRPLAGQLLVYPVTDMGGSYPSHTENAEGFFLDTQTMAWFGAQYVGDPSALGDPRLSPLHGRLDGLAPAVVVTAELDPLRDDGNAYARALAEAGVRVEHRVFPGMIHGFVDMGRHSAAAQAAIEETCALFRTVLHDEAGR